MSATAIDLWSDNDREFVLSGVKLVSIVGSKVVKTPDDAAAITAFLSTGMDSSSAAITGTTVTAAPVGGGTGKYLATFDGATNFPYATLHPYVGQTLYIVFLCPGNLRVAQPVNILDGRPAA